MIAWPCCAARMLSPRGEKQGFAKPAKLFNDKITALESFHSFPPHFRALSLSAPQFSTSDQPTSVFSLAPNTGVFVHTYM